MMAPSDADGVTLERDTAQDGEIINSFGGGVGQSALIAQHTGKLDQGGVCNGLCTDYARHNLKDRSESKRREANYTDKLNNQLADPQDSTKFVNRIQDYQTGMQSSVVGPTPQLTDLANKSFTEALPEKLKNSDMIGLGFDNDKTGAGHALAVQSVKDRDGNITGHKIFDPNFGEYDCSKGKDTKTNLENANNRIKSLHEFYSRPENGGLSSAKTRDLGRVIKDYDIIKNKDPNKNPNKEELQTNSLMNRVAQKDTKAIKELLGPKGANPNSAAKTGLTPLDSASMKGDVGVMQELIKSGAEVNKANPQTGLTPLHWAAFNGHNDAANLLLKKGADPKAKANGSTPSDMARAANHPELSDALKQAEQPKKRFVERFMDTIRPKTNTANEASKDNNKGATPGGTRPTTPDSVFTGADKIETPQKEGWLSNLKAKFTRSAKVRPLDSYTVSKSGEENASAAKEVSSKPTDQAATEAKKFRYGFGDGSEWYKPRIFSPSSSPINKAPTQAKSASAAR
jgi:hypothetical protein